MIYVEIDVAKDKHNYFITNSDGEVLFNSFTISNNRDALTANWNPTRIYHNTIK